MCIRDREEGIKVVTTGAGNPEKYMEMWKAAGIKVIPVVASVALAKRMERYGADAVVAEGTESGGHIGEATTMTLVPQVVDAVSIPVIAKPNAGMPQIDDLGNAVYSMTPADFAGYMKVLVENGASVIGGCCGTTPEFISETAQVLGLQ